MSGSVQILVHGIEGWLVAGVGVNGGHEAMVNANGGMQNLGNRCEAVRGAGRVGHNDMVLGQLVVVHAVNHSEVSAVCRSRDDHALCTCRKVRRCLVPRGENAGAFQSDIHAQFLPRQL
jgi:hypothetical protein